MSLLANDERGDYKQLPGGDDLSRRPTGDASHTSGGTTPLVRWHLALLTTGRSLADISILLSFHPYDSH